MKRNLALLLSVVIAAISVISCEQKEDPQKAEHFNFMTNGPVSASFEKQMVYIEFRTNRNWEAEVTQGSEWAKCLTSDKNDGSRIKNYKINVDLAENSTKAERVATVLIRYGKQGSSISIDIIQGTESSVKLCTVKRITDDIIFSTVPAATNTAVQQGFDFNPETDNIYFSQLNSNYKNIIGWTKRGALPMINTLTPKKMTLLYFSHGNNIRYEKAADGTEYIWIANFGTRNSEERYDDAQILSRVKLVHGKTLRNTEADENFYFGTKAVHASFDVENDQVAIFSKADGYLTKVYKLSEVLKTPVTDVKLPVSITYGGAASPDPEWKGNPVVKAHDCSKMKPLYSFVYNYNAVSRGWQTFCIDKGKAYFFNFYSAKLANNGMAYQSVIDVVDFSGKVLKTDITQPFADNMDDLKAYGFTDDETKYMENEGILIRNNWLYLLYTAKNKEGFRRPVIFKFGTANL